MKRILAAFIAAVMVFSMAACSGGNADVKPAASSSQNAEVKAEQTASSEPEVKAESAASEPEKKEPSEPETKAESEKEQPAPAENQGGYGGPGEIADPNFMGGYGGPGYTMSPDEVDGIPACSIRFADEETTHPNELKYIITDCGTEGEFTVYTIPADTKLIAEINKDVVAVEKSLLNDSAKGYYAEEYKGGLTAEGTWSETSHQLHAGESYTFTLDGPGMWMIRSVDNNGGAICYFYEVKA